LKETEVYGKLMHMCKFILHNPEMELRMKIDIYEDLVRTKKEDYYISKGSPYCDLIYYKSSRDNSLSLALRVVKPEKPGYIKALTHGWHMSIEEFTHMDEPMENNNYLILQVDMRGRAYSQGDPDCNGWELYDVIDAVNFAREYYKDYIKHPDIVYFEGGSGGGGNALSIVGKFPDFFAAATALCGISDYSLWYRNDNEGEFRDEMNVWIGGNPDTNPMAYRSRSGLCLLENLQTPLFIAHGEKDIRVPVEQSRKYVSRAIEIGKSNLVEYMELKGVGTRDHYGNATEKQIKNIFEFSEEMCERNRRQVEIPNKGRMVVAGYLFTKKFSVILDSIDKVAILDYDIEKNEFNISCEVQCEYKIDFKY
jgi:pimeloyl-ACP methyl ester carboxylesterase